MADGTAGFAPGPDDDDAGFTTTDAPPSDEAELGRLAALDLVSYDRTREAAARRLCIRVSTLDTEVSLRRPFPEAAASRGVSLHAPEPWSDPVFADAVLTALASAIRKHVILTLPAADAIALWIAHTYVADRFQHTPRLGITSPVKRCGKSTVLEVLGIVCQRPLKADNISPAGVFRTVEALAPLTLLLDEADAFLRDNEQLRGLLNSGFERSGQVVRVVEVNKEHQPICFRTFAPLALAGIGALPGTLEDRAVPIVLQRKRAGETVMKLRANGARDYLTELASKLARWAADRTNHLTLNPPIPDAMGDREGDISVPLLSIADDAGGEWPRRARSALLTLFGGRASDGAAGETEVMLLADIRALFTSLGATRLGTDRILKELGEMDERPWPEWKAGKPITAVQLSRALRPFSIRPKTVRQRQQTFKGYDWDDFVEAWERYLPLAAETGTAIKPPPAATSDDPDSAGGIID